MTLHTHGRFGVVGVVLVAAVIAAVAAVSAPPASARQDGALSAGGWPGALLLGEEGAQIGVSVADLSERELANAGPVRSGIRIERVDDDSPAAKGGLQRDDIVFEVDGEIIRSARHFSRLVSETVPGRTLRLGVLRGKQRQTLDVVCEAATLGRHRELLERSIERGMTEVGPALRQVEPRLRDLERDLRDLEPGLRAWRESGPDATVFDRSSPRARLGVQVSALTMQLADYFGIADGGMLITSVTSGSAAAAAGLKAGDVIVSVDGDDVKSASDLVAELRDKEGEVSIGIVREKRPSTVRVTLQRF